MKQIDRIRNMNAEELAEAYADLCYYDLCNSCPAYNECRDNYSEDKGCKEHFKAWLESEVEE